jgi:hypothetical protein
MQNFALSGSSAPQLVQAIVAALGTGGMLAAALGTVVCTTCAGGGDIDRCPSSGFMRAGGVAAFVVGCGSGNSAPQLSQNAVPGKLSWPHCGHTTLCSCAVMFTSFQCFVAAQLGWLWVK